MKKSPDVSSSLVDQTHKKLSDLARKHGVANWQTLTKDELVKSLQRKLKSSSQPARLSAKPAKPVAKPLRPTLKPAAKPAAKVAVPPAKPLKPVHTNGNGAARPQAAAKPVPAKAPAAAARTIPPTKPSAKPSSKTPLAPAAPAINKDLSAGSIKSGASKDRILLMVPDPFWLHASWELTSQSVQRAEAALRQDWHGARPIIRLFDVTSQDTTSTSETPIRDIIVHGGCSNWYIDIPQPPRSYRADIGYVSKRGDFYVLARSNVVTPPKAGSAEAIDEAWNEYDGAKKGERVLAMSTGFESSDGDPELKKYLEEKLKRPMGLPKESSFGSGAMTGKKSFFFDLDAKLIVFGKTEPTAHVTLQNEPVRLGADGSFVMWFGLPDSRQIIPAVATSVDGVEERTIVLAVERNTKHLDPMIHDQMSEN